MKKIFWSVTLTNASNRLKKRHTDAKQHVITLDSFHTDLKQGIIAALVQLACRLNVVK